MEATSRMRPWRIRARRTRTVGGVPGRTGVPAGSSGDGAVGSAGRTTTGAIGCSTVGASGGGAGGGEDGTAGATGAGDGAAAEAVVNARSAPRLTPALLCATSR